MRHLERLLIRFGRLYRRDEYIFREDERGSEMFYIIKGRVSIEKEAGRLKKVLAELGPGEYFGEMAPLIDISRSASARVLEDSIVAVIDRDVFHSLLSYSSGVSLLFLKEFSHRLKKTSQALEDMNHSWMTLAVILFFFTHWPFRSQEEALIELAVRTGKEPPEIQDLLEELARKGVILLDGGVVKEFRGDRAWDFLKGAEQTT